jgi:ATP phosphoribosyltransferase regulatory subunit
VRIRRTMRSRWRQVPPGMRDQTASEAAARRWLQTRLLEVFARWGYEEVATPTLEYLDTLLHGAGPGLGDRVMKLVDSGGEVLALRPEMTVPLARFAATRLLSAGRRTLRLAYVASVFRGQERGSGRLREFTQAGVELIGAGGHDADVEVIALAGEALRAARADGAVLSVGHAGFLRGVLSTLSEPTAEAVRDLLYRRAFADLADLVPAGAALDALRLLPTLRGTDALDRARPLATTPESQEALDALREVVEGVRAYDQAVRAEVDLGLIRDFDYYSGIVFEAHGPRAGMPLLGGGRYDGLLERFGHAAPATGFAIGLEPLMEATSLPSVHPPVVALIYAAGAYRRALRVAARLREVGLAVVTVPTGADCGQVSCLVDVGDGDLVVRRGDPEEATPSDDIARTVQAVLEADAWTR